MVEEQKASSDCEKAIKQHIIPIPEITPDGAYAEEQLATNFPKTEEVGTWYNNLTPEGYEEQMNRVNFNETYYIIDEILRLANSP